jgi:hypothetical protein
LADSGAEWDFDPAKQLELAALSRASGGGERVDLASIWSAPRTPEFSDVRQWILPLLLVIFLTETLFTRLGWKLPEPALCMERLPSLPRFHRREKRPHPPSADVAESKLPVASPPPPESDNTRRNRFRRAKRGR